jgi:sugar phosphate permease
MMGSVRTLWTACFFFGIVGLGATGMWTPVITVVQRWFSLQRRGLALGILATGYGLGFATMGAVFPWIVDNFNWRYAWYFLGLSALGLVSANMLLIRSDPETEGVVPWGQKGTEGKGSKRQPTGPTKDFLLQVFRQKTFWLIGISYFCITYCLYGITTFMVDYAINQLGFPLQRASLLATIHGICQVVGVLTILPLSDHLGRKKTVLISNSFILTASAGILFAGGSWCALSLLVGLLAVFYGVTFPIYGACAGDYFQENIMGTVIGAWTPFYGCGAIFAHWMTGILRDTTGLYDYALMINPIMAAAGFLLFLPVKGISAKTI